MEYIEVIIEVTPYSEETCDIVVAEIDDFGFESYLYEEQVIKAYIPRESFEEQRLKTLLSGVASYGISVGYRLNLIKEENWNAVWESSFEPVVVKGECTIKATYHKELPRTRFNITINPKMAFGTGHHQTTSLMVQWLMEEHKKKNIAQKQVLDMGCGTGILAILCAKMKAQTSVHAIDIDPIAVNSTKENCYLNRVHRRITALCGDASLIQANKYDIILANINRNILLEDISTYAMGLRSKGLLFVSGFYEKDIPMIQEAAGKVALKYQGCKIFEEWSALKFAK